MAKIEDYALLGDLHTAALVSTAGSIDWLCLPRFDSPAVFAALLHNDEAGHWTLAPAAGGTCTSRRYAGNTLVLETDWVTAEGAVRVIDFMPRRAGERQHFTHSKVMAWVAADRMARSVREYGLPGPAGRWERLRDRIHHDVMRHGFDAERNTFTQAYGSAALDASLLLIPRVGFLPATDPRVMGTIAAIRHELSDGGLIRRYQTGQTDDGVKGSEGLFVACSFWLVDALHASGQLRDATELFERLLGLRNDVGLLSEEWDPAAQRQLGNTPQAFSHFALVISALQLQRGQMARSDDPMRPVTVG
jgi:GH15 family glucan-1,4-alpha-glucosidase